MAGMVCSALVQETVSRCFSFVLGKLEEKSTSEGDIMERLQMAVSRLEFALERAQELRIRHLSLISRRELIKCAYVKAMELLNKHKQQQQELQVAQGVRRPRWNFWDKNMPVTPSATLNTDDVRRFEQYADCADRFVRDVVSGCSLYHYNFCNPIVRHLLEGKTLRYYLKQGNLRQRFVIWPAYSDERGVEAVLDYRYANSTMTEKNFTLVLFLRLSESTDIIAVANKGLKLFTSEFKLAAECAMGELTLLSNSPDIGLSNGLPLVGYQEWYIKGTQIARPDPACCKGTRHGLCAKDNVSSGLADIFPEEVIVWCFECYSVPALEPSRPSCSSFDVVGRSNSRGGGKPPLVLTALFAPHDKIATGDSFALKINGDVKESRDARIQQVAETLKSKAINCFFHQPELTEYKIILGSKHGSARFIVKKASIERAGAPKTKRRYSTRGSTRRVRRRCS